MPASAISVLPVASVVTSGGGWGASVGVTADLRVLLGATLGLLIAEGEGVDVALKKEEGDFDGVGEGMILGSLAVWLLLVVRLGMWVALILSVGVGVGVGVGACGSRREGARHGLK